MKLVYTDAQRGLTFEWGGGRSVDVFRSDDYEAHAPCFDAFDVWNDETDSPDIGLDVASLASESRQYVAFFEQDRVPLSFDPADTRHDFSIAA